MASQNTEKAKMTHPPASEMSVRDGTHNGRFVIGQAARKEG